MRKKTSISVDEDLWGAFVTHVTSKYGSSRKVSNELENILEKYLKGERKA